jgi:Ca2+-binding RTX toxin-like protein
MAIVNIQSATFLVDFSYWTSAIVQADKTMAYLRPNLLGTYPDTNILIKGSDLAILPNTSNSSNLIGRKASGTITELSINGSTFSGLNISFQSLLDNSKNIYPVILSGNDTITGSFQADTLKGYGGDDRIYGGDGNDTVFGMDGDDVLIGGRGGDVLNGGLGRDTASYSTSAAGVRIDLTNKIGAIGGDADNDSFVSIENATGSNFNDTLTGTATGNQLDGGEGNDILNGNEGNDTLYGRTGNDRLYGGTGDDTLYGSEGNDYLWGNEENDVLWGGTGDDVLSGGHGDDYLSGGSGDDYIRGDFGNDTIYGGEGNNTIFAGGGNDKVFLIDGPQARSSNNIVTLGAGDDKVIINKRDGLDVIKDFQHGDIIDFSQMSHVNLDVLKSTAESTNIGTVLHYHTGVITLEGLQKDMIDWAHDFVFAA